ncbi:MAG: hypothetical protein IIZ78_05030 [Clostridiales bacterium]|nr:hypothetical protein [Clostridiales bacterium]MBQ6573919.1 hypothetical protein [Bacteroidales bacterium]
MTIVERLQLHKLGYTKEEINQLAADNYNPAGLVDPPAEPQPEPEQITAPEPVAAPAQTQQPQQPDQMGEMLQAIRQLTATLQKSNIRNSQQPETPNIAQQADEVLATFLNT